MESDVSGIYTPLMIPIAVGMIFILGVAVFLGKKEKQRLGAALSEVSIDDVDAREIDEAKLALQRPKLFWINVAMIVITVVTLVMGIMQPAPVFMLATSIVLIINYPDVKMQKERIDAHAKSCLMMASTLFAAGAFVGIMQNSGMIYAMSGTLISLLPETLGGFIAVIVGALGVPLSLFFDPDSFYFGIMPVIANTFADFGGDPLMVARASLLGHMTLGFPVSPLTPSTFLLVGLAGIDFGDHQKKTFLWAWAASVLMLIVAVIIGVITVS
jgi:CitMHS family citrate-Mg2+:H+ or citrate-Ca2+:H+ symporter